MKKFKVKIINFEDDNIFAQKPRAVELLQEMINYQKTHAAKIDFTAMNGISIEHLDEEILNLMKQTGFRELNISLASYSERLQNLYNRPFDSQKFADIAVIAKGLGMKVRSYFILGLPEQTKQEIKDTINFLNSLNVMIFPSVYYNVNASKDQWKMQRSSAFFNETEHLCRDTGPKPEIVSQLFDGDACSRLGLDVKGKGAVFSNRFVHGARAAGQVTECDNQPHQSRESGMRSVSASASCDNAYLEEYDVHGYASLLNWERSHWSRNVSLVSSSSFSILMKSLYLANDTSIAIFKSFISTGFTR